MTIDDLGRAAATDAHHKSAQEVDLVSSLEQLHHTRRTQTVSSIVGAVAVAAVVIVTGIVVVSQHHGTVVTPLTSTTPTPTDQNDVCSDPKISCLGSNEFRIALPVPLTVTPPANFQGAFRLIGAGVVEDYRTDLSNTGLTVFENAVPMKNDASWSADPAAGTTAKSMATWLSKRPFLIGARVTETTVSGRPAWHVTGSLKPGAPLVAEKGPIAAAPTFTSGVGTAAYAPSLAGDYTLVDIPGAGVTVIWSWTEIQDQAAQVLAGNQSYLAALRFG